MKDTPSRAWTGTWSLPPILAAPLSSAERRALVALCIGGMGPASLARNLAGADTITDVLAHIDTAPTPAGAEEMLRRAGVRAVVPADEEYPAPLREIDAPPPVLFVRGRRLGDLEPYVAIVGARVCTGGGARFATELAASFARAGFTVVSGLARGIDGAAHRGAVDEGSSVAVLGTGLDTIYPKEHTNLAARITQTGALVSEFPPGVSPRGWHFVARNRIIAGLSLATVVVEAGSSSGALITAGFALDQGREVFACTVAPTTPSGAGVRELLRDGARLVIDVVDTTRDLCEIARVHGYVAEPRAKAAALIAQLDGDRRRVYEAVLEDTSTDEIVARTGLPAPRIAVVLSDLELDGLLCDEGGGRWRRA